MNFLVVYNYFCKYEYNIRPRCINCTLWSRWNYYSNNRFFCCQQYSVNLTLCFLYLCRCATYLCCICSSYPIHHNNNAKKNHAETWHSLFLLE